MEKIEVTAKFRFDGSLIPVEFMIGNEVIRVLDVGRQWEKEDGRHILVMDYQSHTHHLLFQGKDLTWYLIQDMKPPVNPS